VKKRSKVSASFLLAAIAAPGLLVLAFGLLLRSGSPAAPEEPLCEETRSELRFEWLKPGEEPSAELTASPACLALYRMRSRDF